MALYAVVIDANRQDGTIAAIHGAGCRDIARDITPAAFTVDVEGTLRDAMDVAVDEDDRELGYGDEHVKVYRGCVPDDAARRGGPCGLYAHECEQRHGDECPHAI